MDTPISNISKQEHNSRTEQQVMYEIEIGLPFMVTDVVFN